MDCVVFLLFFPKIFNAGFFFFFFFLKKQIFYRGFFFFFFLRKKQYLDASIDVSISYKSL